MKNTATPLTSKGGRAISSVVTLRQAAGRLEREGVTGATPAYVKGAADALGIHLTPVGRALTMTEADYARILARAKAAVRDRELALSA